MFWLSFFLPPLSAALGWMLLLDPRVGLLNQWLAGLLGTPGPFNIYSVHGIVWVHLMSHAISTKVMLLTEPFRNMDSALEEASRMAGATNWSTFLRVTLKLMTPSLIIVFMLGIVRLFESFEIELLLGVPFGFFVFSTKIVNLVRQEPPLISQATALGCFTLLLLLVAVPVQRWLTTRRDYTTVTGRMKSSPIDLGRWRWVAFGLLLLLVILLVAVPIFASIAGSLMTRFGFFNLPQPWTLAHWQRVLTDSSFPRSLANTLIISFIAAVISPLIFSLIAYVIVRSGNVRGRALLDALVWVPSVIPGTLAGLGLLWMFLGTPMFRPLYGSIFLLVIATIMSGVTLSTQIFKGALLNLGRELEEASRMSGTSALGTYFRIVLPLLGPTLVVVATLRFLFAANATSVIILLATSSTRTLSLLTLDYVTEGLRETAAVTATIIVILTTIVALIGRAFGLRNISS
jgi:iron(III) transport system permease protein